MAGERDEVIQVPALHIHADGARTQEGACLQRKAYPLLDLGHLCQFHFQGAHCDARLQPEAVIPDLDHQRLG